MKTLLFFCAFAFSMISYAQVQMPAETRVQWNNLLKVADTWSNNSELSGFPIHEFNGIAYLSLIGRLKPNADWTNLESLGVLKGSLTGRIATMKVPVHILNQLSLGDVYEYMEIPPRVFPDLDKVVHDVRADSVHLGLGLPSDFTGKDVLIGVTDWGFDYTNPMFYDTLYQSTRILAAWDQFRSVGEQPSGFSYGVEFDSQEELFAAQSDTSNIYGFGTHGTHVAGIAGGSGGTSVYRGMAPEASFLFATFLVDVASVLDALHWMKNKAESENKRLVVNMSWGLYYMGTLDGNSLLSQAIDQLSDEGVVFACSAGNNGANDFHIKKTFTGDLLTTRVQFDSYTNPNLWGQSITVWGEPGNVFNLGIKLYSSVNSLLGETPSYSTMTAVSYLDSILVNGNDTVYFNITTEASHPLNGRPHMRIRIKNTHTSLRVVLNATAPSGVVHFWNLAELINGVGNWGLPFLSFGGSTGMAGDSEYSISEPTCTASVISVGAYSASYINVIGNPAGGGLASFTSIGPLITEVMKPDISAPGVNVVSSISAFTDSDYTAFETITFNGTEYDFAKFSGTSMASPCVAGIVALVLEANPLLTAAQVKSILKSTAREDNYTGVIDPPGHPRWGYGKVNAYAAVQLALNTIGLQVEKNELSNQIIWPNPARDFIQINFDQETTLLKLSATDVAGKTVDLNQGKSRVDVSALSPGMYVLTVHTNRGVSNTKLVVN
jgi:minor extracellular serine protease Vpr